MKKGKVIIAYYIGQQYPVLFGLKIEVRDDYSTTAEKYEIRFNGEARWLEGFTSEDWTIQKPIKEVS